MANEVIERITLRPHPDGTIVTLDVIFDDESLEPRWTAPERDAAARDILIDAVENLPAAGVRVPFARLDPAAILPTYAHPGDAGLDLYSLDEATLAAGRTALFPTGISMAIPEGYVGLIHPRSGLARSGVTVLNSPGTVDSGYRGDIGVLLHNASQKSQHIERGQRIAQLVIQRVARAELQEVSTLEDSVRGTDGFGSTGKA